MNTLKDLFIFLSKFIDDRPICIETGTQYIFETDNMVHTSTSNLLKYIIKPKHGILYSFDNDRYRIKKCILGLKNIDDYLNNIRYIYGDSVEQLKIIINELQLKNITNNIDKFLKQEINLAFLDSKEFDEEHMLKEFKIIEPYLSDNFIIMCDDIHNLSSVKYKKAVPYIKERVNLWFEYNTPTGLFVGIKNRDILI